MSRNNKSSAGIKFPSLLGLLFIGLKLGSAIAWSWWWVLAPFWIPILIIVLLAAFIGIFECIND